jgi:hypothetical protein
MGHLAPAGAARRERHRISAGRSREGCSAADLDTPGESRAFAAPPTGFAHSAPCRPPRQFFELFFALHEERQRACTSDREDLSGTANMMPEIFRHTPWNLRARLIR